MPSDDRTSQLAGSVHRTLGRTGLALFPVGLGAMPLSMTGRPDEATAISTIQAAIEAGINFIDTANVYCTSDDEIGHNERLVAKALGFSQLGKEATVAAKGGVDRRQRRVDATPQFLRKSCIDSLRALGRESIYLYQLHAPDPNVPFEDSIGELSRLKDEGKISHVGLCNVSNEHLNLAQNIVRIESVQNLCNPIDDDEYRIGTIAACQAQGVSFLPHSVVGGSNHHRMLALHPTLVRLARKHGTTPYVVVIAWHLAQGECVIPIPGGSRPETVVSSASAVTINLDEDEIASISALSPMRSEAEFAS